jgi:hypothetical protein
LEPGRTKGNDAIPLTPQPEASNESCHSPNYTTEDWNIDKGDGPRSCKLFIQFDTPFLSAPTVLVNLTGIDAPTDHNLRVSLKVERVTVSGFLLKVETWQDSHVNAVEATWFAISRND